ncbi:NAD(P) transhydrogenase subunit alpha [Nitrobacteraceae bacterium AZCC 2146]
MSEPTTTIAVLAEREPRERRAAMVPSDVHLLKSKARFIVERGAGATAGFSDQAYVDAGAEIVDLTAVFAKADVVLAVRPAHDSAALHPGTVLISLAGRNSDMASEFEARGIVHLALERMPRITRAQSMDVLSSQASVAGYAAVMQAACMLDVILPMMTAAAGTIKPAKMIALGAGVAGLQAIATARRLGAVVYGFDVRGAAREQVESLSAKFVFPEIKLSSAEGAGGYASDQSENEQAALRDALSPILSGMQIVVTSAQIPGRPAPLLIDDATIASMGSGTVIIDLAAESGGNTSRTVADEIVVVGGVQIAGPTNLPSLVATDASRLFSGNVRALLDHLIDSEAGLRLRPDDEVTNALLGVRAAALASAAA